MTPEELQTYRIDRTGWDAGPWDTEPDRVDWEHAGLPCFVLRNHHGNWCGYAGVAAGHPLYGQTYHEPDINVHGGLTYSGECRPPICHVPKPGDPDEMFWFGFDCGHAFDVSPGLDANMRQSMRQSGIITPAKIFSADSLETYRTLAYAQAETNRLAEQLAQYPEHAQGVVGGDDEVERPAGGDEGEL